MSNLVKRWLVAAVGIPAVLALIYAGGWVLAVPVAGLAILGALECYRMAATGDITPLAPVGAVGSAAFVLAAAWRPTFTDFAPLAVAIMLLLVVCALLGSLAVRSPEHKPLAAVSVTVFGSAYVGLPLAFAPLLHALPEAHGWFLVETAWAGALVVALPLAAAWLGDAVALYVGTAWGKGGLAPSISPNKSWAGVWGGLAGAALAGGVWFLIVDSRLPGLPMSGPGVAVAVGVLLGIGAILGDLAESLLKRDAGVKDSGTVFPGHGGVLDRLDALLFTLPGAYLALVALEVVA